MSTLNICGRGEESLAGGTSYSRLDHGVARLVPSQSALTFPSHLSKPGHFFSSFLVLKFFSFLSSSFIAPAFFKLEHCGHHPEAGVVPVDSANHTITFHRPLLSASIHGFGKMHEVPIMDM